MLHNNKDKSRFFQPEDRCQDSSKVKILINAHNTEIAGATSKILKELADRGEIILLNEGMNFSSASTSSCHLPLDNLYVKQLSCSTSIITVINQQNFSADPDLPECRIF